MSGPSRGLKGCCQYLTGEKARDFVDNRIDQSAVEFAAERSGEVRELLEVFPWLTPEQAAEAMGSGRADLPPGLQ